MNTIEEAKQYLRDNWREGVECPCCTQLVKAYKRKLNSGMAQTLVLMLKWTVPGEYIHVETYLRENKIHSCHDWALLRHWGLIQSAPKDADSDLPNSGVWKLTQQGVLFGIDSILVPKHVLTFNNVSYGSIGEETTDIHDALGSKFSYTELMNA